jgi:hypothetical protein
MVFQEIFGGFGSKKGICKLAYGLVERLEVSRTRRLTSQACLPFIVT